MIEDHIQHLQDDAWGVLSSDSGFYHVPVYRVRTPLKKDCDNEPIPGQGMMINDSIDEALAGITAKHGKAGIAAIVMLPDVRPVSENSIGPSLELTLKIRIVENRLINEGTMGTGITASRLALHTVQVLNRRPLRGSITLFPDGKRMIEEVSLPGDIMVHEVAMQCTQSVARVPKALAPTVAANVDLITLATATADASIWYTTDGSWPIPEEARFYDGPFKLSAGLTVVRAVAYAEGYTPSDDTWEEIQVTE